MQHTPYSLAFCGVHLSRQCGHIVMLGETRSGKSNLIRVLTPTAILQRGLLAPKVVVHDYDKAWYAVGDSIGIAPDSIRVTSPALELSTDTLSFAHDFTTAGQANSLAETLIPRQMQGNDSYFEPAAQSVIAALIKTLQQTSPGAWCLNDVCELSQNPTVMLHALAQGPHIHEVVTHLAARNQAAGVLGTINSNLTPFRSLAACAARNPAQYSLRDWLRSAAPGVLLLSSEPTYRSAMTALNRLYLTMIMQESLGWTDAQDTEERLWMFLDELPALGQIRSGNMELLTPYLRECHKKGVRLVLASQSVDAMHEVYGVHAGNSILNSCATKAFTASISKATAQFMNESIGRVANQGLNGNPGSLENPILESELGSLGAPSAANGIPVVATSQGKHWSGIVPPSFISRYRRETRPEVEWLAHESKPAHLLESKPLEQVDYDRLGIPWPPPAQAIEELFGVQIPEPPLEITGEEETRF